jgi:molybdopterin converting factor small subunit
VTVGVTVYIPGPLRAFTAGRDVVALPGPGAPATLAAALAALFESCPGLRDRVLDDRGALRRHVNVFIGAERGRLDDPVPDGAELAILPAVSGGRAG